LCEIPSKSVSSTALPSEIFQEEKKKEKEKKEKKFSGRVNSQEKNNVNFKKP